MQIKYIVIIKKQAHYYACPDEAAKMARFVGFPVESIKEVHVW